MSSVREQSPPRGWSEQQIRTVQGTRFRPSVGGYHADDADRLRLRALNTMRRGLPLPDFDAMSVRRTRGRGVNAAEVDGLLTVLKVWGGLVKIESPEEAEARRREEELAAIAAKARADENRRLAWSKTQIERVAKHNFTVAPRRKLAYARGDVDAYLDNVAQAMRDGLEVPDPSVVQFERAGRKRGYDPKEVDDFLDAIASMKPEG